MRSVIKLADDAGIKQIVDQQFEIGRQILDAGLVPIIEPEVDIKSPQKAEAEDLLHAAILGQLDELGADQHVMLKLTLPETDDLYADLVAHPQRPAGRGALRRLQPRRGERPPGPQPGCRRQLLAGPHRGPLGPAERRRVQREARRHDREHLRGLRHLTGATHLMTVGCDQPLYLLAFDHRRPHLDRLFGVTGDPTPEQAATIIAAKTVVFDGFAGRARAGGAAAGAGILVDEEFGAGGRPHRARAAGWTCAMPVERSGLRALRPRVRRRLRAPTSTAFGPTFVKVLVRYNPDGDAADNRASVAALQRLSAWLRGDGPQAHAAS